MIFDFQKIVNKVGVTGVIHIGGFVGEELSQYRACDLYNTIIFEPQPNLFNIIDAKMVDGEQCVNYALGNIEGSMEMYISESPGGIENGSGASSSLLAPYKHLTEHPQIKFTEKINVNVMRLDDWIDENLEIRELPVYNFLNIDVQGYELEVLKGAEKHLENIKGMIVEVNRDEIYKDCAKIWEIDDFLEHRGFERTEIAWQTESWGDAIYEKS